METSAGLVITCQNKILLCHPTNASMIGTWSIPKGHIESGEELLEAACRETFEEIGLKLDYNNIDPDPLEIVYTRKGASSPYKKLYCFHYDAPNIASLKLTSEVLPHTMLQSEEVDCAAFFDKDNLSRYMFWRLEPILKFLK